MYVLTPAQKKQNLDWIEIDKYKPGAGPWDRVRQAPSKVKAILEISKGQMQAINRFEAKEAARMDKIFADPAFSSMAPADRVARMAVGKPSPEEFLRLLTPAQRKEWDAILALTEREYKNAIGVP
jgi:hypothetical protein